MHPSLRAIALVMSLASAGPAWTQSLASPATAVPQNLALGGHAAAQEPPIGFRLRAERTEVRPGGTLILTVAARIPHGWHLYGMQQPAGGPMPTVVRVGPERLFTLAAPVTGSPARAELDPNFGMVVAWHDDSAAFRVPTRAARTALPGTYDVQIRVSYQRCNNRICLPLQTDTLRAPLTVAGTPEPGRRPPARRGGDSAAERSRPEAARPDQQAPARRGGDSAAERSRPEAARPDQQAPAR